MKKILFLALSLFVSIGLMQAKANKRVQIGDMYYILDTKAKTAELISQSEFGLNTIDGVKVTSVKIPATVTYNKKEYRVIRIGGYAFRHCHGLTSVELPEGLLIIDDLAFSQQRKLESVNIPSTVTTIGWRAFDFCQKLKFIVIPKSVTEIREDAFLALDDLWDFKVEEGNKNFCSVDGALYTADTTTLLKIYVTRWSNVYKMPKQVRSIADDAWERCGSMTIEVEDGNETYCSIDGVLYTADTTTLVKIFSVTSSVYKMPKQVRSIADDAWHVNSSMTIEVEEGNENYCSIDGVLFTKDKTRLIKYLKGNYGDDYTVPEGVKTIEDEAFAGNNYLENVWIVGSVTSIGSSAFRNCSNLKTVIIGEHVATVGDEAFARCKSIQTLYLRSDSITFGKRPFAGCLKINKIINYATVPQSINEDFFMEEEDLYYDEGGWVPRATLYVPEKSIPLYREADMWRAFSIEPAPYPNPEPRLRIADRVVTDHKATIEELNASPCFLEVYCPNTLEAFKVRSFEIIIDGHAYDIIGNKVSDQAKERIKTVSPGTIIFFHSIKAERWDGARISLPGFVVVCGDETTQQEEE